MGARSRRTAAHLSQSDDGEHRVALARSSIDGHRIVLGPQRNGIDGEADLVADARTQFVGCLRVQDQIGDRLGSSALGDGEGVKVWICRCWCQSEGALGERLASAGRRRARVDSHGVHAVDLLQGLRHGSDFLTVDEDVLAGNDHKIGLGERVAHGIFEACLQGRADDQRRGDETGSQRDADSHRDESRPVDTDLRQSD